jgi:acyl transferase domain-containing protein/NAD(P)H-dependent flavin oxidoreductase YrpB (nitropropane dioxygenase family)/NAD(P)-dependent dehydrogenase (short-subunit alcohol dehydrogenase family)
MRNFQLMAITAPAMANPSIAVAAARAGALGILDLEFARDQEAALTALVKLGTYGKNDCGVKLAGRAEKFFTRVTSGLPPTVKFVILSYRERDGLYRCVKGLREKNLHILLEVNSVEHAKLGEEVGVDGLIAKGHEAGGWVGEETTFIMLQRLLASVSLPIWAQGGIGLHTAAACYAAGARGVVFDSQLALMRESPLPEPVKADIARMDGSETVCLGGELGLACRVYSKPGIATVEALGRKAHLLEEDPRPRGEVQAVWREAVGERVGWESRRDVWLLGQDATFAKPLADRFHGTGAFLEGVRQAINEHISSARLLRPLDQGAALARSHSTRYPIVQGPMTRVSDKAAFALKVSEAGGLPFLALALMRRHEVEALLRETSELLGDRPWGVGILGFVPFDLRQEQLEAIRVYRPPFALIAGGRPDQARNLESDGIPTYLHVPSPGLLRMFLEMGARRFVFEGRECGGHVGPRSSFVLWNTMIDVLAESLPAASGDDCHALFAAGIHDALSSSMVAAMAGPLAQRGIRIGVLLGTAYLFTKEAVASRAIVEGFQQEAIQCGQTVLLETGAGHATRCAETPYVELFEHERRRLHAAGQSTEEIRNALEDLNLGRLRIASKGIARNPQHGNGPDVPEFLTLPEEEQRNQGMYMIGQVAALRDRTCTVEELHRDVSIGGSERLVEIDEPRWGDIEVQYEERPSDIAIIGMACLLPKANDLKVYWDNILNKVNAITEIPEDRWDWRAYFDPDPKARDKIYSKWGGFLDQVPFDPMRYGIPPAALSSIDPVQLLTLEVVRAALEDAGYGDRDFDREHTSVILGVGGGIGDLGQQYVFRSSLPMYIEGVDPDRVPGLPEWTEDSFPGLLSNVVAGRVANRFNLGGLNYTVDAACASSLAAVHLAARELEGGTSDMVIVGGADTVQNPFAYLCFSKTRALSSLGQCRTFDQRADGIVISEGLAVVVLKRLVDAERAGDRVYAVIKGVGGASDGRARGLTAPLPEGQIRALQRAYAKAGFSLATVGLLEAHGTGTVAGDQAEGEALLRMFASTEGSSQSCAIGSVKSMIGHTKCTAGVAGLIKVALALHHKVLPPTINVEKPNPKIFHSQSALYINSEARPWIIPPTHPRRAGVSSFGFGGTNFHAVLEEYSGDDGNASSGRRWPSELFFWAGSSREEVVKDLASVERALASGARLELHDLAALVWRQTRSRLNSAAMCNARLALVASSLEDVRIKLSRARESWAEERGGIYGSDGVPGAPGKVAFLFPGQGAQYPDMLRDLAVHFHEVRERFEIADRALVGKLPQPLSAYIYPPPRFSPEEEKTARANLTKTNVAQPALGAASVGVLRLLREFGVEPEMVAGHSYGEYVALYAAGAFDEETLYRLSEARGQMIIEAGAGRDLGTMAAVEANAEELREILASISDVLIANLNSPGQTVLSGPKESVARAVDLLMGRGFKTHLLAVACAFHSPLVAPARDLFAEYLRSTPFGELCRDVYSNTTGAVHPRDPRLLVECLVDHLVQPVLFAQEIEEMYAAGARIFVEVGARNVLTSLVREILKDRSHHVVPTDIVGRDGRTQLQHALAELVVCGLPIDLSRLYEGRANPDRDLASLERSAAQLPSTIWMVDGGTVRPITEGATRQGGLPLRATAPAVAAAPARATKVMAAHEGKATPTHAPGSEARGPVGQQHTAPAGAEPDTVILQFQNLMRQFLETQQQVMLTYLHGPSAPELPSEIPVVLSSANGAPPPLPKESPQSFESAELPQNQTVSSAPRDRHSLAELVIQVIAERTGYPREMLGPNLSLEADLGIDSIKRMEILGAFRKQITGAGDGQVQEAMERLTSGKTVGDLIEIAAAILEAPPRSSHAPSAAPAHDGARTVARPQPPAGTETTEAPVPRFLLRAVSIPLESGPLPEVSGRLFLITDDGRGVAEEIGRLLAGRGAEVITLSPDTHLKALHGGRYGARLFDPQGVEELVNHVRRQHRPIAGVLHLLPLRGSPSWDQMSLADWRDRTRLEVKGLFYLTKALASDLRRTAGPRWCFSATPMGGAFGSDGSLEGSPHHAGLVGFIKTLALEWPEVRCRVIDMNPSEPASTLASRILAEMAATDSNVEVGYHAGERVALCPYRAELSPTSPDQIELGPNSVVLSVGGARGITAEVACGLAKIYRPTLILVGRSPWLMDESPETAGLTSPGELRAALLDQARRSGRQVMPVQIEAACTELLHDRERRRNLARIREAGAKVEYYHVDVRDESAFGGLIDQIYERYGRLDGVVHGAGIIEDKLIEDKAAGSFDRVLDTKADSAWILSRKLRPDSLKFLVFFSSVAGRFPNEGQADYCGANEIVNKVAVALERRWPGRVVSINWGPWKEVGMASSGVQRRFIDRGVQLIGPKQGCELFVREIQRGSKGEAEVILGDGPWGVAAKPTGVSGRVSDHRQFSLQSGLSVKPSGGGARDGVRVLDPSVDPYLSDHRLDGKPVLPFAMALELMAEAVQAAWPEWRVTGLRDVRLYKGVVLDNGPKPIRLVLRSSAQPNPELPGVNVTAEITGLEDSSLPYYRGTVELGDRLPEAPISGVPWPQGLDPFPKTVEEGYRDWLFHGPIFRCIDSIEGFSREAIVANLRLSMAEIPWVNTTQPGLVDPRLWDCGPQLVMLWARAVEGISALPVRFGRYTCYDSGSPARCVVRIVEKFDGGTVRADVFFLDREGRVAGRVDDLETSGSQALNRLMGADR